MFVWFSSELVYGFVDTILTHFIDLNTRVLENVCAWKYRHFSLIDHKFVNRMNVFSDPTQSRSSACCRVGKKSRRIKKPVKTSFCLDQALTRMKPSVDERSKYVNVKHILCILDSEESVRLKKVRELRKALEKEENCDETDVGESASTSKTN